MQRDSTGVLNATTTPTLSRSQLRLIADSEEASPQSRINAVTNLLQLYGGSDRNLRVAKKISKRFRKFIGDTEVGQRRIRWAAEQLAARIERIGETAQPGDSDETEADVAPSGHESADTEPKPIIGNLNLLPNDGDDAYWDELIGAYPRRVLFLMSWGLDPSLSRRQVIEAITADPVRLEPMTQRVQLWAMTRDQADAKFARDNELVRAQLTARGLPDTEEGRQELARQIAESGTPLLEFQAREHEDPCAVGPIFTRSAEGLLLDAIKFTATWPDIRLRHQPL